MANENDTYSKTWTDFTKRMKGSKVTQEDWKLFYDKYYGFIVGYIRKHYYQLNDSQVQDVIDLVINAIFVKHSLDGFKTQKGSSFRSWFSSLIRHKVSDYFESQKNKPVFVDEEIIEDDKNFSTAPNVYEKAEKDQWDAYIAYLVLDEVSRKSPAYQSQCFIWSTYNKKKPAQIAVALNMKPEQVYEAIRSFKEKVVNAYQRMGESFDMQTFAWDELKQKADAARAKYLKEAEEFSLRIMQK